MVCSSKSPDGNIEGGSNVLAKYFKELKDGFKEEGLKLPNILTQLRLVGSVIPGLMLILGPSDDNFRIIIVIVFLAIASTDALDGFTARVFHLKTEYGKLLDPIADAFFGFFTLLALCTTNLLAVALMVLTVLRQLHLFWLFHKFNRKGKNVSVVLSGKAKTVAVIVAVVFMLLPKSFIWQGFVIGTVILAGVLILISWLDYGKKYYS